MKAVRKRGPARAFGSNYSNYLATDPRLKPGAKCLYTLVIKPKPGEPGSRYEVEVVIYQLLGEKSAVVKYLCPVSQGPAEKKTLLNKLSFISAGNI